jgi:hypothetical protein
MGTTATSLHILRSSGNTASLSGEIEKAYRRLGYARPKKPAGISAKQVILVGRDDDDFLSIYDSDNDQIDTGELKDLAVQLSKRLASVAILTSIYDGDTFEFVLFHKGKQVDAAVSDPGSHQGGLKFLAGKRRAQAWLDMFYIRDLIRARGAGAPGAFSQRHALERWQDELKKVEASESLAENELAEWCEVVGLDPDRAFGNYGDFTRRAAADGQIMLTLERTGTPAGKAKPPAAPDGAVALKYLVSEDDCPYHGFFPAPWPVPPGATARYRWYVASSGAGFTGLTLRLEIEGTAPLRVEGIGLSVYRFYNGQVTSMTPVAERAGPLPAEGVVEIADFTVPAVEPQTRRQFLLQLDVNVRMPEAGEATLIPVLAPLEAEVQSPSLPPLRLAAVQPSWVPIVSRSEKPDAGRLQAILRLNTPSVLSAAAILPDDGDTSRDRARELIEAWLRRLRPEPGTTAVVHTQRMSPSKKLAKATRPVPLEALTTDKLWPKLFAEASGYQSVLIGLHRADTAHPHAGVALQGPIQLFRRAVFEPTLNCALWMLDHQTVHRALGASPEATIDLFETWLASVDPLQAWVTRAAWIPQFDSWEDFAQTLYEGAATVDWFRSITDDFAAGGRISMARRLRFVAPKLWLDESLMREVDRAALEEVAALRQRRRATEIELLPGRSLAELETALAPLLPTFARLG